MLLLDGNAVAANAFFGTHYKRNDFDEGLFVSSTVRSLLSIITDLINLDSRVVLCVDSPSWRKGVYSEYKNKPKACSEEMYRKYKDAWHTLAADIKLSLPISVQKRDLYEADDLIALHTITGFQSRKIIIVTKDKDLIQLLKFPNVQYWNFSERCFITCPDPAYQLHELICMGDTSDNVPSTVPKKENGKPLFMFGEKTIAKNYDPARQPIPISEAFLKELTTPGKKEPAKAQQYQIDQFLANYERNRTLIDLMEAPWLKRQETMHYALGCMKNIDTCRDFFGAHIPSAYINDGARIDLLMTQLMECREPLV